MSEELRTLPLINTLPKKDGGKKYGMRKGTPIEKGVIINEERLSSSLNNLKKKMNYYTAYPDLFVDEVLTPTDSSFSLLFTQRVILRSLIRFTSIHITAARGFSKTFIAVLAFFIKCIIQPGSKLAITAPSKQQAEGIAKEKINDILTRFPILSKELAKEPTIARGNVKVEFKNGSVIEITAALETTRGRRFHGLLVDELRDQDGDSVNRILLPTLSDTRKTVGLEKINPFEPGNSEIFTTSASSKSSYNYEKLVDLLARSIYMPKDVIVLGIDWRVPVKEGLIGEDFVMGMKTDPTFKEADFAREYLSIYTSESEESWFNFDKMNKHRRIINAEWSAKLRKDLDFFYLFSVDTGRFHDQSVVFIFKVLNSNGTLKARIVNIIVLGRTAESRVFSTQAADLKELIRAFDPIEVVIDTNGLGVGLADQMIQTQVSMDGTVLPPFGFFNDDEYKKIQPKEASQILYSFKATQALNREMHSNAFTRINSGNVDFLIKEQEARRKLMATQRGQKMSLTERTKILMPYEMTSKLFEEMGNLRLKRTGSAMDIVLEQINSRFPKDKFSALEMGLYRIKVREEELSKRQRRYSNRKRSLVFYSGR